jgi:hypothetical protein
MIAKTKKTATNLRFDLIIPAPIFFTGSRDYACKPAIPSIGIGIFWEEISKFGGNGQARLRRSRIE